MKTESWKDRFTEQQLNHIVKYFRGEPPKTCNGKCELVSDMTVDACKNCKWFRDCWGGDVEPYQE